MKVLRLLLPALAALHAGSGETSLTQWSIWEAGFTAERGYANPYERQDDPLLKAAFVHAETGTRIELEGFWDGGSTWRLRFTPTLAGAWRWRTASPDPGLNGQEGVLRAKAPSPDDIARNPNYRGHIKVAPSGRHFVYADSTPFFWLGDTLWAINTRRCGLGPSVDGPFFAWLSNRRAAGFNVVFMEYFEINQENEGGYPYPSNTTDTGKLEELNPEYFRYLDRRMQALWEAGFVVAGHPTWVGKRLGFRPADMRLASRYLLARYGAYNIVWSLSGEYQYSYTNKVATWKTEDWIALGKAVQAYNSFRHPMSVHPSGRQDGAADPKWPKESAKASSGGEFHDEAWLDNNWLQTGHATERLWLIPFRIAENRARSSVKPVVHTEGFYENHRKEGASPAQVRWQAWVAFLSGGAGHGYGASGIWQFFDPEDATCCGIDRLNSRPWGGTRWDAALAYRGAAQLRHLREFCAGLPWWRLEPRREWIRVDGSEPDIKSLADPHCAAIPGELHVVYVPEGNGSRRIEVMHLAEGRWAGRWFNPRDGSSIRIEEGTPISSPGGKPWMAPPVPDEQDWVLHLSGK